MINKDLNKINITAGGLQSKREIEDIRISQTKTKTYT